MNILLDGTILATPSKNRGLGKYCQELLINMRKLMSGDDRLYLLTYNGMTCDFDFNGIENISVYLGPFKAGHGNHRDWLFSVRPFEELGAIAIENMLLKYEIDVFIIFNLDENPFNFIKIIKERGRCGTIFATIVQDLIPLIFRERYLPTKELYERYYTKGLILKYSDIVFAISESAKEDTIKIYDIPEDRIHITYLGTSLKRVRVSENAFSEAAAKFNITKPYMIYTASDEWRKNIDRSIIGFSLSREARDKFQFVIVFKIENRERYSKLIKKYGLEGKVILTDYVSNEELTVLNMNASASIFPSIYEGFGLPVVEAMEYGLPVAVSNVSSMPEITGEGGVFFDPYDEKSIGAAINKILLDKEEVERQKALSDERKSLFSFEKCARTTLDTIKGALEKRDVKAADKSGGVSYPAIYVSEFLLYAVKAKYISFFEDELCTLLIREKNQITDLLYSVQNINKQSYKANPKALKVLFDATVLREGYGKQANRSGIYVAVLNILYELLKRDDICIILYFEEADKIRVESALLELPVSLYHKISFYNGSIYDFDIVFSPCLVIPKRFRCSNGFVRFTFLYDTLPITHPEYFGNPKKEDTWNWDIVSNATAYDYYFADSECAKKDYLSITPAMQADNVIVTPLAASDTFYCCSDKSIIEKAREKYGIPHDKKYIFSLCSVEPRKNLIAAVEAFVEFLKETGARDIVFVLGGAQWYSFAAKFQNVIKKYPDKIIYAGYVDDEDLAPLYSGSLCSIYASLYEGFGLPALEAMKCGTPLIASNSSSIPEVTGDAALPVDPADKKDIVNAIRRIYENEDLRAELSAKGLERAKLFGWDKTADKIAAAFKHAVSEKKYAPIISEDNMPFFPKKKNIIFTIVSKNYLGQALTLHQSLKEQNHADYDFRIFLMDAFVSYEEAEEILNIKQKGVDITFYGEVRKVFKDINFEEMLIKYGVVEMNTAIKPFIIEYLFKTGYDKVIYSDPDIYFYSPIDRLDSLLDEYDIILTPHTVEPFPKDDGYLPDLFTIMRAGMYNCGFIAVRNSENSLKMTEFWRGRLFAHCFIKFEDYMFTDQVWAAWFPALFDKVFILKDLGYNAAYWNLHERLPYFKDNKWYMNDDELVFYHFSGFNPNDYRYISKYQTRYSLDTVNEDYGILAADYAGKLLNNDFERYKSMPYYYNRIPSVDVNISDWERRKIFPEVLYVEKVNPFLLDSGAASKIVKHLSSGSQKAGIAPFGINLIGYFREPHSVGHVARLFADRLYDCGIPFTIYDISERPDQDTEKDIAHILPYFSSECAYPVNIFFINADQIGRFINQDGRYNGKKNIALWAWEFESGFEKYKGSFKGLDGVIYFSEFALNVFRRYAPQTCEISKITAPFFQDWGALAPISDVRKKYGIHKDDFVFFFNFDFNSSYNRKNPESTVRAFGSVLKDEARAKLMIKTTNAASHRDKKERFDNMLDTLGIKRQVIWIDEIMDRAGVMSLVNACDAYVSLHRGEGFGLGMLEAMSMWKPVIASDYSGNREFMNASNALPVKCELADCDDDFAHYKDVEKWAAPDENEAAEYMKKLYFDRDFGLAVGEKAALSVSRQFSKENFFVSVMKLLK